MMALRFNPSGTLLPTTLRWTTSPLLPMMSLATDRSRRIVHAPVVPVVASLCSRGWVDLPAAVPVALACPRHSGRMVRVAVDALKRAEVCHPVCQVECGLEWG